MFREGHLLILWYFSISQICWEGTSFSITDFGSDSSCTSSLAVGVNLVSAFFISAATHGLKLDAVSSQLGSSSSSRH